MTKAANEAVFEILSPKSGVKRKCESYGHYDSEQRAKIANLRVNMEMQVRYDIFRKFLRDP
jgi:hypothetical protein